MYKHIPISSYGSEVARKGADRGLSLAKNLGAKQAASKLPGNVSRSACSQSGRIARGALPAGR
jgi:hypothetical protein